MPARESRFHEDEKVIVLTPEKRQEMLAQIAQRLNTLQDFAVAHPNVLSFALREEFHTRLIQLDTQAREWSDAYVVEFGDTLARLETKFHIENARVHMPLRIRAVQDALDEILGRARELEKTHGGGLFGYLEHQIASLQTELDWMLDKTRRGESFAEIDFFERETDKLKYHLAQLEEEERNRNRSSRA